MLLSLGSEEWIRRIFDNYQKHHYNNRPMQCNAIFNGCKNDNFQMKKIDIVFIFA